ncbi:MAG: LAGLIDADG family homing endonuclease [Candidatus Woesearchaeota archaeon]|jgi:hypothetical protein|nr:LAGLIDADG family homing endonuclease [Candidatus Woesearchaeota archaeon]MDP7506392.1 LAGLIDADG family homing endonuclease [Candidatus Woesearchaeota archaeon]|tara:strand:- start:452 stop:1252 length:801 start_codon:yes stop_codon:yes gene_type:complete
MKKIKISKNELIKRVKILENKLNRKPKKRDDNTLYCYSRKLFGSWNNLMKSAGYKVIYYQKINFMDLNEDSAYFLGLLITDGHIYFNKKIKNYKVAIYTSYPEEKEMILKLIQHLFSYTPGISSRRYGFNKKPNYEIRISSKKLAEIIISEYEIPAGPKSLIVDIPKKIMDNSIKIRIAFLRGVIDGDGSIQPNQIKINSGSEKFIRSLKELLISLTISSGKIYKSKKSETFELKIATRKNIKKLKSIYNTNKFVYLRKKEQIDKV